MKKILFTLPLTVALLVPSYLLAQDRDDRDRGRQHDYRHHVYDKQHRDYHDFDEREERGWHEYWQERHRPYTDWNRASERQRQAYWNWRHNHPGEFRDRDDRRRDDR